jgi:PadR family transcriptional regulator PadR
MSEAYVKEFKKRFVESFPDVVILYLIMTEPMWGYKIMKSIKERFDFKLRHGALYPLLRILEAKGFITSKTEAYGGRIRKKYELTAKGVEFIRSYSDFLKEQLLNLNAAERGDR